MSNEKDSKRTLPFKAQLLIRPAAWGGGVLFLAATAAIIALHLPSIQKVIILRGIERVEAATNLKVQIRSYRWSPFSGIHLTDVKIESEGKQFLDCGEVRFNYRLSIRRPYLVVDKVYLEKPFLQLERDACGKWFFPAFRGKSEERGRSGGPAGADEPTEPLWTQIQLPSIQIVSGTIEAIQQGNSVISIKDIAAAVQLKAVQGEKGPRMQMNFEKLHARAQLGEIGAWGIDGSGELDGRQLLVRRMLLSGPDDCRVQADGQWDLGNPDNGKANLTINNFSGDAVPLLQRHLSGLNAASGSIAIRRTEGRWSFEHDLSTDLGAVKGLLHIDETSSGARCVRLDSRFADLKVHLSPNMPDSMLTGSMQIEALIQGAKLLNAQFTAHLEPSAVGAETVQSCDLNGIFADGVLSISSDALCCSLADFKFKLIADLRGLSDNTHKGGVRAEVSFDRGNLERLNLKVHEQLAGKISVEAGYDPGNFTNLRLWEAKIDAKVHIPEIVSLKSSGTYNGGQVKAEYDTDLLDAQKIALLFPRWQGQGRVVSRGTLNGKWPDLLWDGEISWARFQYANYHAEQISVKGKGRLTGKEERREISIKAQNVVMEGKKLASLCIDLDQQKGSCAFRLKGDEILNQASAQLSGNLERIWEFPLIGVSTQGRFNWKNLSGSIDAKFDIEKDGIRLHSASLQQGRQKISAGGGAISGSRIDIPLSMESINAEQAFELLDLKDRVSGAFSGQAHLSGRPEDPECSLKIEGNNCVVLGKQRIEAFSLQGNYSHQILAVQGTAKADAMREPMAVSAKIPVRLSLKPPQFEVKLPEEFRSDIKISGLYAESIMPFLKFLTQAGGHFDGDIHCNGCLKQPVVSGAGTWKEGFFQCKPWPHGAENIQVQWELDSKCLYVRKAEVSHLGGTVTVTGQIDYPHFKTLDFKAEGKDLQVQDIYGIQGKVSGNAQIKDSPEAAELTGRLLFSNAQMSLGKLETNIAQNIQVIEPNTSGDVVELRGARHPGRFYNRLSMDVLLELPPSGTYVTGKGLKAEISGSLKLKKNPAGPVVLAGELQAIGGAYNFQGKELKIAEGSLVFPGIAHADPELRMICRKDIRDVTVQALISGPVGHPRAALSSIPAMNQVDILSYFMFGRPAGDLSAKQSSQLQSGATSWLGSESSDMVKNLLGTSVIAPDVFSYRSYIGIRDNRFSFDVNPALTGKETGVLEMGKEITPDLHVIYGREVKGTTGNEVQVEYRLNKSVSLRTQVGAEQSGVDIFWRRDFGK
ncbi:MAG TPA: translocation/assembly module TamB domain-containing protein [Syntrophobacteraceae bacterium]|nr:translocation/assembly module TamB domain-containing protein [Syntrophobacteraceae bacterium]